MVSLRLAYQMFGTPSRTKSPILILHGMFGSSNNWRSLGKKIASGVENAVRNAIVACRPMRLILCVVIIQVYALDARNHGNSGHVTQIDYHLMSRDTVQFCEEHRLENVSLIGKLLPW